MSGIGDPIQSGLLEAVMQETMLRKEYSMYKAFFSLCQTSLKKEGKTLPPVLKRFILQKNLEAIGKERAKLLPQFLEAGQKTSPFLFVSCISVDFVSLNSILHTWFRDSSITCDGSPTIHAFPLIFYIGMVLMTHSAGSVTTLSIAFKSAMDSEPYRYT